MFPSTLFAVLALVATLQVIQGFKISGNCVTRTGSTSGFQKRQLNMRWGLQGPQSNKPMGDMPDGKLLRDTVPFELRGFSLPLVVFSIGVLLTGSSFAGFFLSDGGGEGAISSLGFVYGIPVFLIGLSLWYAEIPPAEVISTPEGDKIWDEVATDTFKKIKQDVTRHRYGDDAHLDSTLDSLGLKLPQKKYPKLLSLTQANENDELAFTLTFQSAETPYKVWSDPDRVKRYSKFFGPNVAASVFKVDSSKRLVALKLVTTFKSEPATLEAEPVDPIASNVVTGAEEF